MIELNLLPEELRKSKKGIELPEIPIIPIAVVLIGVLVIIQLLLSGLITLNRRELAVLEKEKKELAPKKAEIGRMKQNISVTEEKVRAIEDLVEKRLNWSCLLNELSNSMTTNIWLTGLSYTEKIEKGIQKSSKGPAKKGKPKKDAGKKYKVRTLTLSGSALGKGGEATAYIARFTEALKSNKKFSRYFEEIEPGPIKKANVAGRDVMNFTLACRFKPEEL